MNKFEHSISLQLAEWWGSYPGGKHTFEEHKIHYVKPEPYRVYTPDFLVERTDGTSFFIETKGYFRPEHRTKMRHVKRCNPDLDIRIIFQKNIVINKKTGFDYLQWAERNGFPCAIGTIPKEWLK